MIDTQKIRDKLLTVDSKNLLIRSLCDEVEKLQEACKAVVDVTEYKDPLSIKVAVIRSRKLCSDALL